MAKGFKSYLICFATVLFIHLFIELNATGGLPQAATSSSSETPAVTATDWLNRALDDAKGINDPILRAEVDSHAAVMFARIEDVTSYRRAIALAQQAVGVTAATQPSSAVSEAVGTARQPLIKALAKKGEIEVAQAEVDAGDPIYHDVDESSLAAGQAARGDLAGALKTAQQITNPLYHGLVMREIASELATRGEFATAKRIALPLAEPDNFIALTNLAHCEASANDIPDALALADSLDAIDEKQAIFQEVVEVQARCGKVEDAKKTAAMVPLGVALGAPSPTSPQIGRDVAYLKIASVQLKKHDIDGALATSQLVSQDSSRCSLIANIIFTQVFKDGDADAARRSVDFLPSFDRTGITAGSREASINSVATRFASEGRIESAIEVAGKQHNPDRTLLIIANFSINQNRRDIAQSLLDRVTRSTPATSTTSPVITDEALSIASLKQRLGGGKEYDDLIHTIERDIDQQKDPDTLELERRTLVNFYLEKDDVPAAMKMIYQMSSIARAGSVPFFAKQLQRSNHSKEAAELLALIPKPTRRVDIVELLKVDGRDPMEMDWPAYIASLPSPGERTSAEVAAAEVAWAKQN